jgi:UDP-3-O-[3-hydroxymyristoyl] N-acetylglucosamine deacetylase
LGAKEARVSTVEHLLAALRGLDVDNIHIDVEGGEIPIMDGSAATFVLLLKDAGILRQNAPRKVWRIRKPLVLSRDGKSIKAYPYDGFHVDCTISFPHQLIGVQRFVLDLTPESFASIAKARTFGFLREVEMMRSCGLALGGSLDNAVVLDDRGVVNTGGLRFDDEFVRHKVLDFIGDMAMLDLPLQGRFVTVCSGHALNNEFLRTVSVGAAQYLEKVVLPRRNSSPASRVRTERSPEPALAI